MRTDSPYSRPDGRELRSARTRNRIFETALAEFRQAGFEAASVANIARAAGVSRPSFYFHFPTKEHVLLELQWQIEVDVAEAIARVDTPSEALHAFVDRLALAEAEVGSSELFRDMLQIWARPPASLDLQNHPSPCLEEVVKRFIAHAREGVSLPMAPERAALLFLSAVFGYLLTVGGSREEQAGDLHALVALHMGQA